MCRDHRRVLGRELGLFFFFNDTATTEIYTLSLHDALPISSAPSSARSRPSPRCRPGRGGSRSEEHTSELQSPYAISYAVFCLTKRIAHRIGSARQGTGSNESLRSVRVID